MTDIRSLGKSDIKINNRLLVLNLIKEYHAISRIQLSKITNMSPTSMTRIVNDLKELSLVCEVDTASNPLGRKATMIAINKDAYYSIGITISKTGIRMAIIDTTYTVLYITDYEWDGEKRTSTEIAEYVYLKFPEFMFQAEEATALELRKDICCMGVSFPGMVDDRHKSIITSPILGEEIKEKLCSELSRLFYLPVYVENDIKAALYNEYQRFGKKADQDIAYLYLDVGLGTALMVDGKIYRGNSYGAGEIAYAFVEGSDQVPFYRKLTYLKIISDARQHGIPVETLKELGKRYEAGEEKAEALLQDTAARLARMLNIINVFYNPSKIIIGGSVIRDLPMLLPMAWEKKELFYQVLYDNLQVVMAHEPTGGEEIGAAIVALDEYLKSKLKDKWYQ